MNKHSVQDLRHRAEFFKAESLKDIAEAMPLMMTGNPASAPLMRSAGAQAIMAGMCDEMADEIEAHAETRKRLLKLQWKMARRNRPVVCPFLVPPQRRGFTGNVDKGNKRAMIFFAAKHRAMFHEAGRGVPR